MSNLTEHTLALEDDIYAEMIAYGDDALMPLSEVIARSWRLYRDMAAMRDNNQVPRSALTAWQEEHPELVEDDSEESPLERCPHCNGWHPVGTIEQCPLKPKREG